LHLALGQGRIGAMSRGVLELVRERVAEAVDDGATLDEVENEVLLPAPVSGDARDALWLYAWNLREQAQRPDDAR
jgi:hypothetical protein